MTKRKKVVFIFGPTGVGKTRLAVEVAEGMGEIISVDSMQVYRGMECGTSKPGEEELGKVKHYLVSIVNPDFRFSAGDFKKLALKAIAEIYQRGKIPILVGGTGLYFRALEYNLAQAPAADLAQREAYYREEECKRGILYEKLKTLDPETAKTLHPNDLVRVVRALEIYALSGMKFSDFIKKKSHQELEILKIGITMERDALYKRLEHRCKRMIESGLAREVYGLLRKGYNEKQPSMKGLGYSHFIRYFQGCCSYTEVVRLFIRDTKRYAKRQLTWFNRESGTIWYGPEDYQTVRERIKFFMGV